MEGRGEAGGGGCFVLFSEVTVVEDNVSTILPAIVVPFQLAVLPYLAFSLNSQFCRSIDARRTS